MKICREPLCKFCSTRRMEILSAIVDGDQILQKWSNIFVRPDQSREVQPWLSRWCSEQSMRNNVGLQRGLLAGGSSNRMFTVKRIQPADRLAVDAQKRLTP